MMKIHHISNWLRLVMVKITIKSPLNHHIKISRLVKMGANY
jgi:hypothetical protein